VVSLVTCRSGNWQPAGWVLRNERARRSPQKKLWSFPSAASFSSNTFRHHPGHLLPNNAPESWGRCRPLSSPQTAPHRGQAFVIQPTPGVPKLAPHTPLQAARIEQFPMPPHSASGWSLSPAPTSRRPRVRLGRPAGKRTGLCPTGCLVLVAMIVDAGVRAPTLDSAAWCCGHIRVPRGPLQPQHPPMPP